MGFRSTFTTSDVSIKWPDWFVEKYRALIWFEYNSSGPLHPVREKKHYMAWATLPQDIQKAIDWNRIDNFIVVFLHECGGITRCQIEKDAMKWSEPLDWLRTDGITHDYCYGCSNAPE